MALALGAVTPRSAEAKFAQGPKASAPESVQKPGKWTGGGARRSGRNAVYVFDGRLAFGHWLAKPGASRGLGQREEFIGEKGEKFVPLRRIFTT